MTRPTSNTPSTAAAPSPTADGADRGGPLPPAAPASTRLRRRLWLGLGAGAAVTGLGVALWQQRGEPNAPAPAGSADLWSRRFATPDGAELVLERFRGQPLVVNFWATWCPPCVEEMPELDAFFNEQRASGWQVLGLAIDQPSAVRTFLQKIPVGFPIGLAGLEGSELMRALGNASGGLPFTVLVSSTGQVTQRRMGKTNLAELRLWASTLKNLK